MSVTLKTTASIYEGKALDSHMTTLPEPVTRYFQKVDRALAGASHDQKIALIAAETRKWESRYIEFQTICASNEPMQGKYKGAHANDFIFTLNGLSERVPRKEAA